MQLILKIYHTWKYIFKFCTKKTNLAKKEVVKKAVYDKLVAKGNNMDAFILKTKYQTDKAELEKKIS